MLEPFLFEEVPSDLRQFVKGVLKNRRIWCIAVAEAWIIRRYDMETVRQLRNQVSILMRRSWPTVQQH